MTAETEMAPSTGPRDGTRGHERRAHGERRATVELGRRFRAGTAVAAVAAAAFGLSLFVSPATAGDWWPWRLTPLTARVIGGWLLALGTALGAWAREHDWAAVRLIVPQAVVPTSLLFVGAARFGEELDRHEPASWVYVGGLVPSLAASLLIWLGMEARYRHAAHAKEAP